MLAHQRNNGVQHMRKFFKRLGTALHNFFFPPAGTKMWLRVLPYAILGVLTIIVLIGAAYGWQYTNSPQFCGTSCHTMPPEYTAYLASPHARVDCTECHIGRGFIATQITRKAGDLSHVINTVFHNYTYPIYAANMRPARDTCEKCHNPDKFSDDSLHENKTFQNNTDNTPFSIFLSLKTGGGTTRQGLGKGIHWHVENKVMYYATDELQQNIPYIRVYNTDGTYTEYTDIASNFNPANITEADMKEMDCVTCHNRVTHLVPMPADQVDAALARGFMDKTIPDIRAKGIEVLSVPYTSQQEGLNGIYGLFNYYQAYYPEYYAANQPAVQNAVSYLQTMYIDSVNIDQLSDWNTHPNNVGHLYFAGCFRCHDGKHMDSKQQAVRLECNLCHTIPEVAGPADFVTNIEIPRGPEPQSHLNANWIAMHNEVYNQTCSDCHTTGNPGGTDNSSFCSNSACHGIDWKYAGLDAPALRETILSALPPTPTPSPLNLSGPLTYDATIGPLFTSRCGACHGEDGIQGLNLTTYQTAMKGSVNGPVIIPGDAAGSPLVQKQSGSTPHFGQLSPEELSLVIDWINTGAPEK
jgi:nitrate/TMAO reductase-like tetraheme cytochrome c subunit/mono/diheme cytochrome c family protein